MCLQGSYHVRLHVYTEEPRYSYFCIDGWLIFANVTSDYTPCSDPTSQPPADDMISMFINGLFNGRQDAADAAASHKFKMDEPSAKVDV